MIYNDLIKIYSILIYFLLNHYKLKNYIYNSYNIMYCSIQEAWPEYNSKSNVNNTHKQIESFIPNSSMNQQLIENRPELVKSSINIPKITETFNNPEYKCINYLDHIENCDQCRTYLIQKYSKNRLIEILNNNPQLKETIVVFLIGLVIIMILNLFYK